VRNHPLGRSCSAYTYSWHITGTIRGYQFFSGIWCATTQVSGSGAYRRHGSRSLQPWSASLQAATFRREPVGLPGISYREARRMGIEREFRKAIR
jgi:hypothetical protein